MKLHRLLLLSLMVMLVAGLNSVAFGQFQATRITNGHQDHRHDSQLLKPWQRDSVLMIERNLGGPRMGVTYVPGNGVLVQSLRRLSVGPMLSQFGWHFEYQVIPDGGGPQFIVQFVPMIAGVEYGTIIPHGTLAMGIRFPDGLEFGLGPNVMLTTAGAASALVMSIGKSFNYGGVSIPLNAVVTTNPHGTRISLIFGYAIGW